MIEDDVIDFVGLKWFACFAYSGQIFVSLMQTLTRVGLGHVNIARRLLSIFLSLVVDFGSLIVDMRQFLNLIVWKYRLSSLRREHRSANYFVDSNLI